MNPGAEPMSYGNVQYWLDQAAANYGSVDLSKFSVVTNTGPLALTGQVQEFIVRTPEPSTWLMLLFGLAALILLARRQLFLKASAQSSPFANPSPPMSLRRALFFVTVHSAARRVGASRRAQHGKTAATMGNGAVSQAVGSARNHRS